MKGIMQMQEVLQTNLEIRNVRDYSAISQGTKAPAPRPRDYCNYQSSKWSYLNQTSQSVLQLHSPKSVQGFGITHHWKSCPAWFFNSYFFTYFSSWALFCLCLGLHFVFLRRDITNTEPRFCLSPRLNFLSSCLPSGSNTISTQHSILQRDLFNFSPSSPTYLHPLPVFWVQTHSPPWVLPCLGSTSWHSWGWRNTLAQPLSATWRCSSPDRFFPISSLQWQLLFTFSLQMRSCSPLIHQADHVIKPRQLCFTFFLDPLLQHIKQMFHCQGSLGSNSHLSLSIKKATLSFVPLMIKALISLLKHSGRHLWAFSHAAVSANLPSLSSKFSFDVMSIKSLSAGLWVCWHHATNSA